MGSKVKALFSIAGILLAFTFLAPTTIGGRTTYITVQGISMQPNLYTGDLVVLQKQSDYKIGDAIAYKSSFAGATILHRVIEINYDDAGRKRFSLQGDNNNFVDVDEPTIQEVLGKQVVRIPSGSSLIDWAKEPFGMAVLFTTAGLFLFSSIIFGVKRGRHKRKH